MSQIVDRLERSHNHRRGYRNGVSGEEVRASFVFVPRYVKYVIPAIQIAIGILGAILLGILLFP